MSEEKIDALLQKVDADKRALLKRIMLGAVVAAPVVVSLPIDGLSLHSNLAMSGNASAFDNF